MIARGKRRLAAAILAAFTAWPIVHFADEPYLGRKQRLNRRRSHQGSLLMLEALHYIREAFPFWNASAGRDHVWMMLHDEGPCFCPLAIRQSILLTHYGYYSETPKPWGTFYDDNFFADKGFYRKFLGDPDRPTRCFKRGRDLVVMPPVRLVKRDGGLTETGLKVPLQLQHLQHLERGFVRLVRADS